MTKATLVDKFGKTVETIQVEGLFENLPEVIRSNDKYFRRDVGEERFVQYREASFLWAHQSDYKPYMSFTGDISPYYLGSYKTFKEADAQGRTVIDIRNTARFYVDGKGWSDGRK